MKRTKSLLLPAHVVVRTSNLKFSSGHLAGHVKNIAAGGVPHVQHDYFSSCSQSHHWFVTLSLRFPSTYLKLLNMQKLIWYSKCSPILIQNEFHVLKNNYTDLYSSIIGLSSTYLTTSSRLAWRLNYRTCTSITEVRVRVTVQAFPSTI